jgi:inorganic pyrophosphatase
MTTKAIPSDYAYQFLDKDLTVKVDRPLGSTHPKHDDIVYPVNYGYIEGVEAPDGEDVDAYILGVDKPLQEFRGKCIALIHRTNDDDDKLIVVPEGKSYSDDQIRQMTEFQEKFFKSEIIRLLK